MASAGLETKVLFSPIPVSDLYCVCNMDAARPPNGLDLIFSSDLIPTLPCPGGAILRDDLLGKRKPSLQVGGPGDSAGLCGVKSSKQATTSQPAPGAVFQVGHVIPGGTLPPGLSGAKTDAARPQRSHTVDGIEKPKKQSSASTRAIEAIRQAAKAGKLSSSSGQSMKPPAREALRRVASAEPSEPAPSGQSRSGAARQAAPQHADVGKPSQRKTHARTASESSVNELRRPVRHATAPQIRGSPPGPSTLDVQVMKHSRSASLDPATLSETLRAKPIRLGQDASPYDPINIHLASLQKLVPESRKPTEVTTGDQGVLDPTALLVPFTIVLEALVYERTILRSGKPAPLPALPDTSSLTLSYAPHELDWKTAGMYMTSLGAIVDGLMPSLRDSEERDAVEELVKKLRAYVGKSKKVFGEVAGMYVDGYGFCRGWWDETDMKAAAGEVGRWGDLFDV